MIVLDTTYILPLVGTGIKKDLLKAVVEKRTKTEIDIQDISINLISVFEVA